MIHEIKTDEIVQDYLIGIASRDLGDYLNLPFDKEKTIQPKNNFGVGLNNNSLGGSD